MTGTSNIEMRIGSFPSMVPSVAIVRRVIWETDDTYTLLIDPPRGDGRTFAFNAGQFNMV